MRRITAAAHVVRRMREVAHVARRMCESTAAAVVRLMYRMTAAASACKNAAALFFVRFMRRSSAAASSASACRSAAASACRNVVSSACRCAALHVVRRMHKSTAAAVVRLMYRMTAAASACKSAAALFFVRFMRRSSAAASSVSACRNVVSSACRSAAASAHRSTTALYVARRMREVAHVVRRMRESTAAAVVRKSVLALFGCRCAAASARRNMMSSACRSAAALYIVRRMHKSTAAAVVRKSVLALSGCRCAAASARRNMMSSACKNTAALYFVRRMREAAHVVRRMRESTAALVVRKSVVALSACRSAAASACKNAAALFFVRFMRRSSAAASSASACRSAAAPAIYRGRSSILIVLVLAGIAGCATTELQTLQSYYEILDAPSTILTNALEISARIEDEEARAMALRDIAHAFIVQDQPDNAFRVLEDATMELLRSSTIDPTFNYPATTRISTHTSSSGSIVRAHAYMDLLEEYQLLSRPERNEELLYAALNEILRAEESDAHRSALMRFIVLVRVLGIDNDTIRNKPIEAILLYRDPILYGTLVRFLINTYAEDNQDSASEIFVEYARTLALEYREQNDWIALAVHYVLGEFGQLTTSDIARIRLLMRDTETKFADNQSVRAVAKSLAAAHREDLIALYQNIKNPALKCTALFSESIPDIRVLLEDNIYQALSNCITRRVSDSESAHYSRAAATFAIRTNDPLHAPLVNLILRSSTEYDIGIYFHIAQLYNDTAQYEIARFYLNQFTNLYDRRITRYEDAAHFATLYARLHSYDELLTQFQKRRNPLIKIALLIEVQNALI